MITKRRQNPLVIPSGILGGFFMPEVTPDFAAARAKARLASLAAPRVRRNGFAITFPEMTKQALSYG